MPTPARPARLWWTLCALFGLATIGFVVWFTRHIPTHTCSGPLPEGVTSLLAFQLATTPAEIEAVFGQAIDTCRAAMVAALDRVDRVDLLGFIPTYGLFLATFLLALRREGVARPAHVGLVFLVVGLAFDVLETATQLYITRALPGSDAELTALTIASRGKFSALAAVALCAGLGLFARGGLLRRIAAIACIVGAGISVAGLAGGPAAAMLPRGGVLSWTAMLVVAVAEALRPSRSSPIVAAGIVGAVLAPIAAAP